MIRKTKYVLSRNLVNAKGWRTKRKIVVIESDDWGSIRMPSKYVYNKLLKEGVRVDKCPYNKYDTLASEDDLNALFHILLSFKDSKGNHPIITANTVVANPDFKKIKESNFLEYHYEPFTDTLQRYTKHKTSFELWKQGMTSKIFHPQFHGREHVNIPLWLSLLKKKNAVFLKAFDLGLWGIGPQVLNTGRLNIQASFDSLDKASLIYQKNILKEGLDLFQNIFGYRSESFIANNFIWDSSLNSTLFENGVSIFQGMKYQKLPLLDSTKRKMIRHYCGKTNNLGQVFLIRNCSFEPSQKDKKNVVSNCMFDISNSFFWNKPAIINSHRLNYIGNIDQDNRMENLSLFRKLLIDILKTWPDVEFMTSDQLGRIILESKAE